MPTVIPTSKPAYAVKNLGWLLRHWKEVQWLGYNLASDKHDHGELVAKLKNGTAYFTQFESLSICFNWLRRPCFDTLPFSVVDLKTGARKHFVIGDTDYKRINKLPYNEQMESLRP